MDYHLGDCQVRGEDRRVELVCWFKDGWLLGDGRVVPATEVQEVRGRETFDLAEPWLAEVYCTPGGFIPLEVVGHGPAGWLTDRGTFAAVFEPVPLPPTVLLILDADGHPVRLHGTDMYLASQHPNWDGNDPGPAPGDCTVIGYSGNYWQTATGDFLLPQDVCLSAPNQDQFFSLACPIRSLGGRTATGFGPERQFVTDQGPDGILFGPIPPGAHTSEERIQGLLDRTPGYFLNYAHKRCVDRNAGVTVADAGESLNVKLPSELLFNLPHGRLCPVGAFLRWFAGFTEAEVSLIHPPEAVDYRRRLGSLVAKMDPASRALWSGMLAGDEEARRDYADLVECQGDPGRATLLRAGLTKRGHRSLDDGWASFQAVPPPQ